MEWHFQSKCPSQRMEEVASELEDWFSVSGDMDDFIFYDDSDKQHSEK